MTLCATKSGHSATTASLLPRLRLLLLVPGKTKRLHVLLQSPDFAAHASSSQSGAQRLFGLAGEVRVVDRSLERLQRSDHGRSVTTVRRDEERRAAWLQRVAHVFDELFIDSGFHHLADGRATGHAENQATNREQEPPDDQPEHAADGRATFDRAVNLVVDVDLAVFAAPNHRAVVN